MRAGGIAPARVVLPPNREELVHVCWRYYPSTSGIATEPRSSMCVGGIAPALVVLPPNREEDEHVCWRYCPRTGGIAPGIAPGSGLRRSVAPEDPR